MNRLSFIRVAVFFLASAFSLVAPAQSSNTPKNKVVFQVSDADTGKWNLALNNVKNAQDSFGADMVAIEIVVYGPGIGMLKADSAASNRVNEAIKAGVQIVACENTMTAMKLSKSDMNSSIGYVPAGVVEIMKRQSEGWAYVRP